MQRNVVVATDLLEPGDRVVALGAAVAAALSATVQLVHVMEPPPELPGTLVPELRVARDAMRARRARRTTRLEGALDFEVNRLRELSVAAEAHLITGHPWESIVEECVVREAAMVVVGPHASTQPSWGSDRRLLGATADRVVRRAPCPVLVASRHRDPPATLEGARWLMGVDESRPSLAALRYLRSLVNDTGGRLFVTRILRDADSEDPIKEPSALVQLDLERRALDELTTLVGEVCPEATIVPPRACPRFSVAESLCSVANEQRADVLCVGTHGRSELSRVLLGSTAERVLRHATIPVLVLRSDK